MRTNQTKKPQSSGRRPILMITGILVIAAITIIVCLVIKLNTANNPSTTDTASQTSTAETTTSTDTRTTSDPSDATGKTPIQYEPTDADTSILSGSFTGIAPTNDILSVRILINQQVPSSSTCDLEVTSASGLISHYSAPVINNPSTASCEGYDIPLSELPSGEPLQFTLRLTVDSETYTIAEQSTTL